jgi:hypothetical protein
LNARPVGTRSTYRVRDPDRLSKFQLPFRLRLGSAAELGRASKRTEGTEMPQTVTGSEQAPAQEATEVEAWVTARA